MSSTAFTLMSEIQHAIQTVCPDFEFEHRSINPMIEYANTVMAALGEIPDWQSNKLSVPDNNEPTDRINTYLLTFDGLVDLMDRMLREQDLVLTTAQKESTLPALRALHHDLARPYCSITPGMGVAAWLATDEVGMSSRFMVTYLHPDRLPTSEYAFPYDMSDFDRCVGALTACPELNALLPQMRFVSPAWAALVELWPTLTAINNADDDERYHQGTQLLAQCRETSQTS